MKINEVIRKYRKEQNLTQEQIANYLGVTAPAVNKWENGISYPDITLLAPLARILKIDIDTLLSFKEELTDIEINQFLKEVSTIIQEDSYEKAFEKGAELIKEYPNCDRLILFVAQILFAYLSLLDIDKREKYEAQIVGWYEIAATSKEKEIVSMATASLCQIHMAKKEYDKAQQLLDKIPPLGYDKRMMQAMLFYNQDKKKEAYEVYELMLYKASNEICSTLQLIANMLCKEKKYDIAEKYADLGKKVAELFHLGTYIAYTPKMLVAIQKEDKEESIRMLEKMVEGLETMGDFENSPLYTHIKFKKIENMSDAKKMIKRALESDKDLDFIREEIGYKRVLSKLE